jgi:hypothetical protein
MALRTRDGGTKPATAMTDDHDADGHAPDRTRRALLMAAPLGLLASCTPSASAPSAFTARFQVAGTGPIALDYADERNFAFTADIGWGATCVVAGRIHLVILPSLATAGSTRVIWAGDIGPSTIAAASNRSAPALRPSAVPARTQRRWGLDRPAQDLAWPGTSAEAKPTMVTVGDIAPLARAQHAIDTLMRPAMDMSLCGDGVNRLIATWPADVTRRGLAVLASTAGVELMAPLRPLARVPSLPEGVQIEDFRIAFGRAP